MLNRFLAAKGAEGKEPRKKRPYLATECRDLNEADQWRQQILREIGKKVMEIQNAGLGEHRWVKGGARTWWPSNPACKPLKAACPRPLGSAPPLTLPLRPPGRRAQRYPNPALPAPPGCET